MGSAGGIDHVIGGENSPRRLEERMISDLAASQYGVITRRQLLQLGFSRRKVDRLMRSGWLRSLHHGVYVIGPRLNAHGRWLGAVLACGPNSVLSHRSAADHWGLLAVGSLIEISAPRSRVRRPGIVIHRVRLHEEDRVRHEGIPVTSVARTLLDLAGFVRPRHLERAVEQAERLGLFDLTAIERLEARSRDGKVSRCCERSSTTIASRRPRGPSSNGGFSIYAEMRGCRRRPSTPSSSGDASLQLEGYRVLRVTNRRLEAEPEVVVATVRSLLRTAVEHAEPVSLARRGSPG